MIKPNTFIHAMGNAHVMFQFIAGTNDVASTHIHRFIQKLVDHNVIHSREADTDIEIGVDEVDVGTPEAPEKMMVSRVWVWVDISKLHALQTFAELIPRKVG